MNPLTLASLDQEHQDDYQLLDFLERNLLESACAKIDLFEKALTWVAQLDLSLILEVEVVLEGLDKFGQVREVGGLLKGGVFGLLSLWF